VELFMSRLYAATVIAVAVTLVLATRLLLLRTSRSAIEGLVARLLFDADWLLRSVKSRIHDWTAAMPPGRQRKAANSLRLDYNDDQSRESRPHDGGIDDVGCGCDHGSCRLADQSGEGAAGEVGR
jgi:hypothetical protein